MSDMQQLPKDDPRIVAWEEYRQSAEYANTRNWALREAHVDGSLWTAFVSGWQASRAAPQITEPVGVEEMRLDIRMSLDALLAGEATLDETLNDLAALAALSARPQQAADVEAVARKFYETAAALGLKEHGLESTPWVDVPEKEREQLRFCMAVAMGQPASGRVEQ